VVDEHIKTEETHFDPGNLVGRWFRSRFIPVVVPVVRQMGCFGHCFNFDIVLIGESKTSGPIR